MIQNVFGNGWKIMLKDTREMPTHEQCSDKSITDLEADSKTKQTF